PPTVLHQYFPHLGFGPTLSLYVPQRGDQYPAGQCIAHAIAGRIDAVRMVRGGHKKNTSRGAARKIRLGQYGYGGGTTLDDRTFFARSDDASGSGSMGEKPGNVRDQKG